MRSGPTITHLPPDGQVRAVEAILTAGGYPPNGSTIRVVWDPDASPEHGPRIYWAPGAVPYELVWKAIGVSGTMTRCFSCWLNNVNPCEHDFEVTL